MPTSPSALSAVIYVIPTAQIHNDLWCPFIDDLKRVFLAGRCAFDEEILRLSADKYLSERRITGFRCPELELYYVNPAQGLHPFEAWVRFYDPAAELWWNLNVPPVERADLDMALYQELVDTPTGNPLPLRRPSPCQAT